MIKMKQKNLLQKIRQKFFSDLNSKELNILRKLSTPRKIQDFLEKIPIILDDDHNTCLSPRQVLRDNKARCIEGALLGAVALFFHGEPPLLLDLKAVGYDYDHVVALFRKDGKWGALSKTNHAVLRYREPIYRDVRELTLSYFHEYFMDDGRKTLRSFSGPFNLARSVKSGWITSEKNLWHIVDALEKAKHFPILTKKAMANLRPADPIEIEAGKLTQWKKG